MKLVFYRGKRWRAAEGLTADLWDEEEGTGEPLRLDSVTIVAIEWQTCNLNWRATSIGQSP
jgi:hypothetical protein